MPIYINLQQPADSYLVKKFSFGGAAILLYGSLIFYLTSTGNLVGIVFGSAGAVLIPLLLLLAAYKYNQRPSRTPNIAPRRRRRTSSLACQRDHVTATDVSVCRPRPMAPLTFSDPLFVANIPSSTPSERTDSYVEIGVTLPVDELPPYSRASVFQNTSLADHVCVSRQRTETPPPICEQTIASKRFRISNPASVSRTQPDFTTVDVHVHANLLHGINTSSRVNRTAAELVRVKPATDNPPPYCATVVLQNRHLEEVHRRTTSMERTETPPPSYEQSVGSERFESSHVPLSSTPLGIHPATTSVNEHRRIQRQTVDRL